MNLRSAANTPYVKGWRSATTLARGLHCRSGCNRDSFISREAKKKRKGTTISRVGLGRLDPVRLERAISKNRGKCCNIDKKLRPSLRVSRTGPSSIFGPPKRRVPSSNSIPKYRHKIKADTGNPQLTAFRFPFSARCPPVN